jgi:hypothetical protein
MNTQTCNYEKGSFILSFTKLIVGTQTKYLSIDVHDVDTTYHYIDILKSNAISSTNNNIKMTLNELYSLFESIATGNGVSISTKVELTISHKSETTMTILLLIHDDSFDKILHIYTFNLLKNVIKISPVPITPKCSMSKNLIEKSPQTFLLEEHKTKMYLTCHEVLKVNDYFKNEMEKKNDYLENEIKVNHKLENRIVEQ